MIRTENLTRDYGGGRGIVDLNLHVPPGTIYGYIGPNGAGKTTTIRMLCGLAKPTSGRAFINGVEVTPANQASIKRAIGYLPDIFGVYDQMSVWEYLDFFCAAYRIRPAAREARIREALHLTDSTYMLDYQVISLSRGMRQRIGLAKTLLHDPAVLILDEPAGGLDPHARIEMRRTIERLRDVGKTILLSSHILPELASVCDLIGILKNGRLVAQGSVAEITEQLREKIVLVATVDGGVPKAVRLCLQHPGVDEASAAGDEIRIVFSGTRPAVADLTERLVTGGVRVMSLREEEPDLEQVFLTVTGDDGSDENEQG
ncbi:MAG: ABC transporter ATP-binding protein [Lentisphaerae bacterium]|nr:ABC transporter ATP-binding protein [Lentisphaerota bacterium]